MSRGPEKLVMEIIRDIGKVRPKDLMDLTSDFYSKRAITKALHNLIEEGVIEKWACVTDMRTVWYGLKGGKDRCIKM